MVVTCPRCHAPVGDGRFCTNCGASLEQRAEARATQRGAEGAPPDVGRPAVGAAGEEDAPTRLVACHRCGAVNASSRDRCARCRADLTAERPMPGAGQPTARSAGNGAGRAGGSPAASAGHQQAGRDVGAAGWAGAVEGEDRDPPLPGVLLLVTVIAAVAVLAVVLTLLSARGVGPFTGPADDATDAVQVGGVEVTGVAATSELAGAGATGYDAENLIDGDPTTAWNEGETGDGAGERLELTLAGPTDVTGLLIWNGYQSGDRYAQHNRVRTLRVEIADRAFRVRLLDRRGPQAIELPAPVRAERISLEIVTTFPGDRYNDAALSEIDVLGVPADDQPSTNV